jgi:hypothetical protein
MTEQRWTTEDLDRIGKADELSIAPRRKDGTLRRAVPISVARVGDELYLDAISPALAWFAAPPRCR